MKSKYSLKACFNILVNALGWLKWFFSELWRYCRYKVKVFYKKYKFLRFFTLKNKLLLVVLVLFFFGGIFFAGMKYEDHRNQKRDKEVILIGEDVETTNQNSAQSPPKPDLGNFSISIDKIGVVAPIIRGVDPADKQKYDQSLEDGVAHMVGTALPGAGAGNIFIYGHSSSPTKSAYSKVFADLNELENGDRVKITSKNEDFIYIVSDKKIVEKTDLSVMDPTADETLTLMTCWPIGTDDKRLIVTALRK